MKTKLFLTTSILSLALTGCGGGSETAAGSGSLDNFKDDLDRLEELAANGTVLDANGDEVTFNYNAVDGETLVDRIEAGNYNLPLEGARYGMLSNFGFRKDLTSVEALLRNNPESDLSPNTTTNQVHYMNFDMGSALGYDKSYAPVFDLDFGDEEFFYAYIEFLRSDSKETIALAITDTHGEYMGLMNTISTKLDVSEYFFESLDSENTINTREEDHFYLINGTDYYNSGFKLNYDVSSEVRGYVAARFQDPSVTNFDLVLKVCDKTNACESQTVENITFHYK